MTIYDKRPAWSGFAPFILLALVACTAAPATPATLTPSFTPQPNIPFFPTSTPEPVETHQVMRVFTPVATNTPWIFWSGLNIEEHPLAKRPEIEPLVIYPLDALMQAEVLDKHEDEWGKTLPPNEYYNVGGGNLWVVQGSDKLEAVYGEASDGSPAARVTRAGEVIFSTPIKPPGTTSPLRVLTIYDDHWAFEVAQEKVILTNQEVDSFFTGEIFVDGQSLNALYGYEESYGFQTLHGQPFYFFKRDGKIGISYDGQEILLGYDGVQHYGCCSGGALNPRIAQNIISFFAWRGEQWYYTEIGVFER
jgi:hypothetical protein